MGSPQLRVLLIEDDLLVSKAVTPYLSQHDCEVFTDLSSFLDGLNTSLIKKGADLILLDLMSPKDPRGEKSLGRIAELKRNFPTAEIYVQSGVSSVEIMRKAISQGAHRFIAKENLIPELPQILDTLLALQSLRMELDQSLLGRSEAMLALKRDLLSLRMSGSDVLIEGETGSGKELCARALHSGSEFCAVNMSAVPDELFEAEFFGAEKGAYSGASQNRVGYFEAAAGGTLFLDEIQSLKLEHQAKLLRVLETRSFCRVGSTSERPFRARLLCASNQSLREKVKEGTFREDLFYRIAPVEIRIPPLRARPQDVSLLAQRFLADFDPSRRLRWDFSAIEYLESYDWPGNVRQLRGLVRSLVLKSPIPVLDKVSVQEALGHSAEEQVPEINQAFADKEAFRVDWQCGYDENLRNFERHLLEQILRRYSANEGWEKMNIKRSRFYEKIKNFGLSK